MTGFLLLFALAIWVAIDTSLSVFVTTRLAGTEWRVPIAIVVFAVLLPLPLIDEIVGGQQFKQLCKENSTIQVDRATASGRTVYFDPQQNVDVKGTWVRVVLQPKRFVDATTGQLVVSYNTLIAAGGRFSQALAISEGGMPITFDGSCRPTENPKDLFKSLDIKALDRPN